MAQPEKVDEFNGRVEAFCRENNLLGPGDRVLVALSGGPDSVALMDVMIRLEKRLNLKLYAAHLHHGLRGKEAELDQKLAEEVCEEAGVPYFSRKAQVGEYAQTHGLSPEEAGRKLRYAFFEELADTHRLNRVATGHHLDDHIETVLMRIIKGTGLHGLRGIPVIRPPYIRPLRAVTRAEIMEYLSLRKLRYRTDQSNQNRTYLRNRIRHDLLPIIRDQFDPQIGRHLDQLSGFSRETAEFLDHHTTEAFRASTSEESGKIILDIDRFEGYFSILKKLVLMRLLHRFLGSEAEVRKSDLTSILDLVSNRQSGKTFFVGNAVRVLKDRRTLVFEPTVDESGFCHDVVPDRAYTFEGFEFRSRSVSKSDIVFSRKSEIEYADADVVAAPLTLRNWQEGDRFHPLGMNTSQKISDFFVNQKVPLNLKNRIPILVSGSPPNEVIVWVCAHRLDDRFRITDNTQKALEMECLIKA